MSDAPSTSGQSAGQPTRLKATREIVVAAVNQLGAGGTDRAAAMAYYAIQALFPGIFVVVFLALLVTSEASITAVLDWAVEQGMDGKLAESLRGSITGAAERASGAIGVAAIIAAGTALSSASGWFAAMGRAIEPDPERRRGRNIVTGRVRAIFWTVILIVLLIIALGILAAGGSVADQLFEWLGIGNDGREVWGVLRPPLAIVGIVAALLVIYRLAPDHRVPVPVRYLAPGALSAGLLLIVATLVFFFYIRNLSSIGTTYGAFATPIVLLLWLYVGGVVVLFGAAVNAELARRRGDLRIPRALPGADDPEIAGHPAGRLPEDDDDQPAFAGTPGSVADTRETEIDAELIDAELPAGTPRDER